MIKCVGLLANALIVPFVVTKNESPKMSSCPKSVIDDQRFCGNELWLDRLRGSSPKAADRPASRNPKPPGCLQFGICQNQYYHPLGTGLFFQEHDSFAFVSLIEGRCRS